jgi:hypothetical protein
MNEPPLTPREEEIVTELEADFQGHGAPDAGDLFRKWARRIAKAERDAKLKHKYKRLTKNMKEGTRALSTFVSGGRP